MTTVETQEGVLDRIKRLDKEVHPAPWRVGVDGVPYSLTPAEAELIVTLRNLAPEIVEAFTLLEEIDYSLGIESPELEARAEALLRTVGERD